ncbi:MAG: hypothetical protein WC460_00100 [Patescibacteria group bacterium]
MKKIAFILIAVFILVLGLGENVSYGAEHNPRYVGQYQVSLNHSFWKFGDEGKSSMYAHACVFGNVSDDFTLIFSYLGPRFRLFNQLDAYVLTGIYSDSAGSSVINSLWLDYPFGKNDVFAEVDYYVTLQNQPHQLFATMEASRLFKDDVSIGGAIEAFGNLENGQFGELAYGPFVQFKFLRFWVAYDGTPALPGEIVFLRTSLKFTF